MLKRNEIAFLAVGKGARRGLTDHLKYLVYEFFHSERIDCVVLSSRMITLEESYTLINLKVAVDQKTSQYELSNLEKHVMRDIRFSHAQYEMVYGKVNIVKWLIFRMGKYLDQKRERLERDHISRIKAGSSLDTEAALEARLAERKASETASGMTVESAKTKIDLVNEKIAKERRAKKQAEKEEKEKLKKEEKQRKREEQKEAKRKAKEERKEFLKTQEDQKVKDDVGEPKVEEPKKDESSKEESKQDKTDDKAPVESSADAKGVPNDKSEKEEKADGSDESKGEDSRE